MSPRPGGYAPPVPTPDHEVAQIDQELQRDGDAPRRTHLANERTFLAWWRSGLASMTVGFAVGKFGPAVGNTALDSEWAFVTLGVGFVLLGVAFIVYGLRRRRAIDAALQAGRRIPPDDAWFVGFTVATTVLGAGLLAVLLFTG